MKRELVLQQELPCPPGDQATRLATAKMNANCDDASGYTSLMFAEACQCPHLEKYLPHLLNLDFCKLPSSSSNGNGNGSNHRSSTNGGRNKKLKQSHQPLVLENPIHALHLASQLEASGTIMEPTATANLGKMPWLYGVEQQRSFALSQEGIPETFYPLTKRHLFCQFTPPSEQLLQQAAREAQEDSKKAAVPSPPACVPEATPAVVSSDRPLTAPAQESAAPSAPSVVTSSSTIATTDPKSGTTTFVPPPAKPVSTPSVKFATPIVQEFASSSSEIAPKGSILEAVIATSGASSEFAAAAAAKVEDGDKTIGQLEPAASSYSTTTVIVQAVATADEATKSNEVQSAPVDGGDDVDKPTSSEQQDAAATIEHAAARTDNMGDADGKQDETIPMDVDKPSQEDATTNSNAERSGEATNMTDYEVLAAATATPMEVDKPSDEDTQQSGTATEEESKVKEDEGTTKEKAIQLDADTKVQESSGRSDADKEEVVKPLDVAEFQNAAKEQVKPNANEVTVSGANQEERKPSPPATAIITSSQVDPVEKDASLPDKVGSLSSVRSTAAEPAGATPLVANEPTPVIAPSPAKPPPYALSELRYLDLSRREEQINSFRALLSKRMQQKQVAKAKKRKSGTSPQSLPAPEGYHHPFSHNPFMTGYQSPNSAKNNPTSVPPLTQGNSALQILPGAENYQSQRNLRTMTEAEHEQWQEQKAMACQVVERWLEHYRSSRRAYWDEETSLKQQRGRQNNNQVGTINVVSKTNWSEPTCVRRSCLLCKVPRGLVGDDIMQCLECSFVGCSPSSISPRSKRQHILQHLFLSRHNFAVTCGAKAEVFCFKCGDFVYHKVFDQEKERLDLAAHIPWLAWDDHPLQRSFDPLSFLKQEDFGIVWRGLVATYPPLVPPEHLEAAKVCRQRQTVFDGNIGMEWPLIGRKALDFAIRQGRMTVIDRWTIPAPVGLYNLGNTCFKSSILQCLVHCPPLQLYFLKDIGHHHVACKAYRHGLHSKALKDAHSSKDPTAMSRLVADDHCLACEFDRLFLQYFSRSVGCDVVSILGDRSPISGNHKSCAADLFEEISGKDEESIRKGEPLIPATMLHAAWKSGGMGHLAGYEQRDAHEFLHAFLDILGKHICQHRARVDDALQMAKLGNPLASPPEKGHHDIIKHLFEGTLRSVLVCEECGSKRTLCEPFLNISLPLTNLLNSSDLSVDRCLRHFTTPETLADPVDCPSCRKKTRTKKQHTLARLPRVLCVHLKRFHAALNKKIEDFCAFTPVLNMGPHLPHWREVTTVPDIARGAPQEGATSVAPEILYDLYGTVNHRGSLQSGHYFTHVKVKGTWFRCNDQHVSLCTMDDVLKCDGAYMLFYMRR